MGVRDVSGLKLQGNGEFREAIQPMVDALMRIPPATVGLAEANGYMPAHDSPAMAEHGLEAKFASGTWTTPADIAHSYASTLLNSAAEAAEGFALVLAHARTPVFSHVALARMVLEHSAASAWLSEPKVSIEVRAKRAWSERLYSAENLRRTKLPQAKADANIVLDKVRAAGREFRWAIDRKACSVGGEKRWGVPQLLCNMYGAESRLGDVIWSYSSSILHGSAWALQQHLHMAPSSPLEPDIAAVVASSSSIYNMGVLVGDALIAATTSYAALQGWSLHDWSKAVAPFGATRRSYLEAMASAASLQIV